MFQFVQAVQKPPLRLRQTNAFIPLGGGFRPLLRGQHDRHAEARSEAFQERVLIPAGKGPVLLPLRGQAEGIHAAQGNADLALADLLVVEILPGEIRIQGQDPLERRRRILQGGAFSPGLLPELGHLAAGDLEILAGGAAAAQALLDISAVLIGLGKIREEGYGLVVIVQGVQPLLHLGEEDGSVVVGQHVLGVDVDHAVHVLQSLVHLADLGVDEAAVVEGQGVAGLAAEHLVEIGHGLVPAALRIMELRPVEIIERPVGVELQRLVEVGERLFGLSLGGVETAAAGITLRLETVDADGLVVVRQGLDRVLQEEIAGAAVEVGGRILGLLADVFVEVGDGRLELLREEVGHPAREIEAGVARTQGNRPFKVLQGLVVLAETTLGDGAVVIAGGEDGIEPDAAVEVGAGAAKVAQVVLGDAPVEEGPVVGCIELGQDVETLDGVAVALVDDGLAADEIEVVLVILRPQRKRAQQEKSQRRETPEKDFPYG